MDHCLLYCIPQCCDVSGIDVARTNNTLLCRYIDNPDFVPETVAKQSNAAKSLCIWVHAMDKFHIVNKVVEPKKLKLAKAEAELAQANAQLKEKQNALQSVLGKVAALEAQLKQAQQEQQNLNDQVPSNIL
jgi:dynein heavy chain, axonemal